MHLSASYCISMVADNLPRCKNLTQHKGLDCCEYGGCLLSKQKRKNTKTNKHGIPMPTSSGPQSFKLRLQYTWLLIGNLEPAVCLAYCCTIQNAVNAQEGPAPSILSS